MWMKWVIEAPHGQDAWNCVDSCVDKNCWYAPKHRFIKLQIDLFHKPHSLQKRAPMGRGLTFTLSAINGCRKTLKLLFAQGSCFLSMHAWAVWYACTQPVNVHIFLSILHCVLNWGLYQSVDVLLHIIGYLPANWVYCRLLTENTIIAIIELTF